MAILRYISVLMARASVASVAAGPYCSAVVAWVRSDRSSAVVPARSCRHGAGLGGPHV
jgi:hypothetical protein